MLSLLAPCASSCSGRAPHLVQTAAAHLVSPLSGRQAASPTLQVTLPSVSVVLTRLFLGNIAELMFMVIEVYFHSRHIGSTHRKLRYGVKLTFPCST